MRLIILLLLILILLSIIINYYITKEKYTCIKKEKKFDVNIPLQNEKYLIFNNNYNAKFLPVIKEFNNENVNDLAYNKNEIIPQIINNNLSSSFIKYIILKYNDTNYIINNNEFDNALNNFGLLNKIDQNTIDKLNKKTYINNEIFNPNKDFYVKYIDSEINEINILNNYFIDTFNKIYFKFFKKLYKQYDSIKNKFLIYKYKILNMYQFNNIYFFELIFELIKINGLIITELFITSYIYNGKIFLKPIVLIGFKTLDEILLKNNSNHSYNDNYNIIKSVNNDGMINNKNIPKILNKRKFEIEKNINLKKNYNCFNNNLNNKNILRSNSKQNCESNYNIYGIRKNFGIWDRPCVSDNECLYYKSNKNYLNEFGKCLDNGYCENPINVKNISYHIFSESKKPLCYNCNNNTWNVDTELNDCCEEQKNKEKYPFLEGPDYAFKNDLIKRFNHKIYNSSYMKYNDIFNKNKYNIFKNN